MNHLNEEQMIDLLLGEVQDRDAEGHLTGCEACADRYDLLQKGLAGARKIKARMPLMPVPTISFDKYRRRTRKSRLTWLAAAAMLFISILGCRVEIGPQGVVIQFALLGQGPQSTNNAETRLAALETRVVEALEINKSLTQLQMDARFNAFSMERDNELGQFTQVLRQNLESLDLSHDHKLVALEDDLLAAIRKDNIKGQLR